MPPPQSPAPERTERTLLEELAYSQSNRNAAVPAFPGYVSARRSGPQDVVPNQIMDTDTIRVSNPAPPANMTGPHLNGLEGTGSASDAQPEPSSRSKGKQRATDGESEKDPYQVAFEQVERRQSQDDPSYPVPSQDVPETPSESIDPEEAAALAEFNVDLRSPTLPHDMSAPLPRMGLRTVVSANETGMVPALDQAERRECDHCKDHVDADTAWCCMQCGTDWDLCTTCYCDGLVSSSAHAGHRIERRMDRMPGVTAGQRAALVSPTSTKKQPKHTEREGYGVRHTKYMNLGEQGQRERDELVQTIRQNWPKKADSEFWPSDLMPISDGIPLHQLREVSSSLLRAMAPLSEATKRNLPAAHRAMIDAVDARLDLKPGDKRKLIADDIKEATRVCSTPQRQKRTRATADETTEQGPSTKRTRRSDQTPLAPPALPAAASSVTLGRSQPVLPNEPQQDAAAAAAAQVDELSDRDLTPTPDDERINALFEPSQDDLNDRPPQQTVTPPMSPEVLSQVCKTLRDTPVTTTVEMSTDTDWSDHIEMLKTSFYWTCLKARSEGKKKFTITFSAEESAATPA